MSDQARTRNFCIIAHVDHGKTTLSDRLLQATGTISDRQMTEQHLDSMDLERERGITIKAHPVTMDYKAKNGTIYQLNLIDTPGHVDFAYEVSRSLSACEGALLIIDAAQGVEAQTVANVHLANKQGLKLIPVINKIDLPNADVETVKKQLEDVLTIPGDEAILASAKNGIGITEILEAVIARIPAPKKYEDDYTRALVFDTADHILQFPVVPVARKAVQSAARPTGISQRFGQTPHHGRIWVDPVTSGASCSTGTSPYRSTG